MCHAALRAACRDTPRHATPHLQVYGLLFFGYFVSCFYIYVIWAEARSLAPGSDGQPNDPGPIFVAAGFTITTMLSLIAVQSPLYALAIQAQAWCVGLQCFGSCLYLVAM